MASSTPKSSPVRQEHNPHPYSIKTTTTGILTRSNSSKAHGSWSKHHYTPVPSSPSAISVFDPTQSSPSPTRRTAKLPADAPQPSPSNKSHLHETPQRSEKGSSSPSKYSQTVVVRDITGEQFNVPRHPYLWTPPQLAAYLSTQLNNSDGESLDPDIVQNITDFIQQEKIGGRAFLSLDLEDFQEMEGVDSVWSNALWDASCTLRQDVAPYRPSRISSSSYKRGRVRGIVKVFERSASESSDVGDDETHSTLIPNKLPVTAGPSSRKRTTNIQKTQNPAAWSLSESEDDPMKVALDQRWRHNSRTDQTKAQDPSRPSMHPSTSDDPFLPQDISISPLPVPRQDEVTLVPVLPPSSGTPVSLVLVSNDPPVRDTNPALPEDDTPHREVEIVSEANEASEPTMAELYAQTYGSQPPSPRTRKPKPSTNDPSDDGPLKETMKLLPTAPPPTSAPSTTLRPVARRRASPPPQSLRGLFSLAPEPVAAIKQPDASVFPGGHPSSNREQAALRTLEALKERLEIVERRLEAMEIKEAEEQQQQLSDQLPGQSEYQIYPEYARAGSQDAYDDLDDVVPTAYSSNRIGDMAGEALRSWQSTYILLAGATGGVSVVLIPMILRHFWSR